MKDGYDKMILVYWAEKIWSILFGFLTGLAAGFVISKVLG